MDVTLRILNPCGKTRFRKRHQRIGLNSVFQKRPERMGSKPRNFKTGVFAWLIAPTTDEATK